MIRFVSFGKYRDENPLIYGDQFLVVFPDGVVKFCYYSRRGYFRTEENYEVEGFEHTYETLDCYDSILVSKVEVIEDV